MVYRKLDPAEDWQAFCDDNPEPPELEEVPEKFWIFGCKKCDEEHGEYPMVYDDVDKKDGKFHCPDCGWLVEPHDYDLDKYKKYIDSRCE